MLCENAPEFTLLGVDGKLHALAEYDRYDVLILIQWANHCPYAQAWEARVNELQDRFGPRGAHFVAIGSNDPRLSQPDTYEEMVRRASERAFAFEYLHDKDQRLARALGSTRTPEVFLFDAQRRLVYHGAIDDNYDETKTTTGYLANALDAVLVGEMPDPQDTQLVGCTVKWSEGNGAK
jgi:hypothetical protein